MKTFDLFGEASQARPLFPTPRSQDAKHAEATQYELQRPPQKDLLHVHIARLNPSTYSSAASPARISRWQGAARASTEPGAVFGGNSTDLSVSFDLDTSSWRTSLRSLFGGCLPYLERFPQSGMMRNGRLYRRPRSVPRTLEKDSSLWPTPTNSMMTVGDVEQARFAGNDPRRLDYETANKMWPTPHASCSTGAGTQGRDGGLKVQTAVKDRALFPTPSARDWKSSNASSKTMARNARPLNETVTQGQGGSLNADWVELLMGFPPGWTVIGSGASSEPSEGK